MVPIVPPLMVVPLKQPPALPDLEFVLRFWTKKDEDEFDRKCREQADGLRRHRSAMAAWYEFFKLHGIRPDSLRGGSKNWYREFLLDAGVLRTYPPTFAESRPDIEKILVNGRVVVLRKDMDDIYKIMAEVRRVTSIPREAARAVGYASF